MSEGEGAEPVRVLSLRDFLALEQNGDRRHELVGGRIYDMAGGTEHDLYDEVDAIATT